MATAELIRAAKEEKARRILAGRRDQGDPSFGKVTMALAQSVVRGFNRGLAQSAGGFVDLVNLPLGIEKPVGGSEWLKEKAEQADLVGGEKYRFLSRAAEVPGMAAPFFGAGGLAARLGATGGKYLAPILQSYRLTPGYNAAMELYTAGRAGVGGAIAQELFPESGTAEVVGQVAGGLVSPVAVGGPIVKKAVGGIGKVVSPFVKGGAERAAAKQVQKIVTGDPAKAAKALRASKEAGLTSAQELGDPGLLRLQKAFEGADPNIAQAISDKAAVVRGQQQAEFAALAGGERGATSEFLQQRIAYVTEQAENMSTRAVLKAKNALDELPAGVSREAESIAVRESINKSYKQARIKEGKLWDLVDGEHLVNTKDVFGTYNKTIAGLAKAERGDIPEVITKHLAKKAAKKTRFLAKEPLSEIKAFRTKLLEASRREASETVPDRKVLRILSDMQETALVAMEKSGAGGALEEARVFSRQLNKRFTEGIIGEIRGTSRRGGPAVADAETLLRIIREGPSGAVRYDKLLDATQNDPQAIAAVENYISRLFVKQATNETGRVVPRSAGRFMKSHSELLDRLPALRKRLSTAKGSQELADRTSKRMAGRVKSLWDKKRSRAALYLGGSPTSRIRKVLGSEKPIENMRELVKQVRSDPTGNALVGLKGELLDEMMRHGATSSKNMEVFYGGTSRVFNEVFSSAEQSRILTMIDKAKKLEAAVVGGKSLQQVLDETPDAMVDLLSRIIGANLGGMSIIGQSTGAPIVAAGAGSKFVRNLTNKIPMHRTRDILAEAVIDKTKMAQLLERIQEPKQAAVFTRRMNSWLVGIIPEMAKRKKKQETTEKDVAPFMMQIPLGNRLTQ